MVSLPEAPFRLADADRLRFRSFEGDQTGLVFDTLSGNTHLLNLLGFELGLLLREGPKTRSQLVSAFDGADAHQAASADFLSALDGQLSRLQWLGLIEALAV